MRLFTPATRTITATRNITTGRYLTHPTISTTRLPTTAPTIQNNHGNQIRAYSSSSGAEKGTPQPPPFNPETYLHQATKTLSNIPPKLIPDTLHPTQSHLLSLALSSHLPSICLPAGFSFFTSSSSSSPFPWPQPEQAALLPGYHLAYYPLQTPPQLLFPDGTDADHCPGAPFTRRMWAGGRIEFGTGSEQNFNVDGRKTVCVETLGTPPVVQIGKMGKEEEQRVWVDVWRTYVTFPPETPSKQMEEVVRDVVRDLQAAGAGAGAGGQECATISEAAKASKEGVISELRRLVFLREREPGSKLEPARVIRVPHQPDFSFKMTPDATLLFQFSALTFNAHAIHLDPLYAREVEGYKERLVHGPLTLVIMLRAVEGFLRAASSSTSTVTSAGADTDPATAAHAATHISEGIRERLFIPEEEPKKKTQWEIASIEYKNLRPLFVGEEMKVCVRLLPNKQQQKNGVDEAGLGLCLGEPRRERVDVWIEAPDGGLAVKGTVGVESR
ncbi:hypothetical protein SMACR_05354 [Sordaria macrospora]|uniref:WGS project CABT00000000 data, contig 2.25 n=2 Tax=Sordaria macrospora TaxID=5147 RepID=F7W3M6_SORMK|nr:uncharacterized protein SMAC_05354 [Sordaria macrospora k-hell]KAA8633810.1 hypothetical protein SMACR_05354 [Sordaria macrospora]WPJ63386.1 hypothetical protein SMAC4_05354 [Sordaria macrospora]CCC12282.1 unnamed protein product [Sordaria macrospora k-hell]